MSTLPKPRVDIPEVMFIGRSNVGKSSLVNMLCNRKALASTSATPGMYFVHMYMLMCASVIIVVFAYRPYQAFSFLRGEYE